MPLSPISRALAALVLTAACGAASAATVALPTGATVTIDGWEHGSGISVTGHNKGVFIANAGAFGGSLTGAGAFSTQDFLTYCVELTESIGFGSAIGGYSVVSGLDYFGSAKVDTLGRLMTLAAAKPAVVGDALGSAAMQVAIWNTVYDEDQLTGQGSFRLDRSFGQGGLILAANALLRDASALASQFDVYVLKKSGSQDLLLSLPTGTGTTPPSSAVPEPGSAALGLLALGALGASLRRRRG